MARVARIARNRAWAAGWLCVAAAAQQPVVTVPADCHLQTQVWDATSGLPQNTVSSLLFDRAGMLWVATFGGLCRFDGIEWRTEATDETGLRDQRITLLACDAAGELLVGTERGLLYQRRQDRFEVLAELPGSNLRFAVPRDEGVLWCGTSAGLFEVRSDGSSERARVLELRADPHDPRALLETPDGPRLVSRAGVVALEDPLRAPLLRLPCSSAAQLADGRVFLGSQEGLMSYGGDACQRLEDLGAGVDPTAPVTALVATPSGRLWFSIGSWLCRVDPDGAVPPLALPIQHRVRTLLLQSESELWIGFEGGGLVRLFESEVDLHALPVLGRPVNEPHAVLPDGAGGWWVGTELGLFRFTAGRFDLDPTMPQVPIGALAAGADGAVWIGTDHGVTLLRGAGQEHFASGVPGRVRAVFVDDQDRVWCGTERGVRWLQDRRWQEPPAALALEGETVKLIARTPDGDVWVGSDRSLLRIGPDQRVKLRLQNGVELPRGEVRAVLPTSSGRVWLGCYGGGFVAVDGDRLRTVGAAEGLYDPFVCSCIALDRRWLVGSNRGSYLVEAAALDRVVDRVSSRLACRPLFGPRGAAAEANGGVQPSAFCVGDQALMCGLRGVLAVDRRRLHSWSVPASCSIERVAAGGAVLRAAGQAEVVVSADVERVFSVDVTAPCFDAPQLQCYRWRLLPGMPHWSEPSVDRRISFGVSAPGRHRFEVLAWSVDGRASPVPTALVFDVQPRLAERAAFQVGIVLLALLLAGAAIRFGGRRAARRARLLRRLVDERTAELRELHAALEARVAERTAELRSALDQLHLDHGKRLELERELQQFQRMESLGSLAGGVAHDFNNLLTVVLGNASLLETELSPDSPVTELATRIREAAEQGRRMTQHLLTVASCQVVQTEVVDLVDQVRGQQPLLAQLVGAAVRLELDLPQVPLRVRAAPVQLEQVLSNLCVNAKDALVGGGTVRIAARRVDEGIELRVVDDGPGMSEPTRRRAFEPFFTTKRGGRGTGLGLATVYGITKQLGGRVAIESVQGEGTTFVLVLPAAAEVEVPIPRPQGTQAPSPERPEVPPVR